MPEKSAIPYMFVGSIDFAYVYDISIWIKNCSGLQSYCDTSYSRGGVNQMWTSKYGIC